jgi:hypothetical protein
MMNTIAPFRSKLLWAYRTTPLLFLDDEDIQVVEMIT